MADPSPECLVLPVEVEDEGENDQDGSDVVGSKNLKTQKNSTEDIFVITMLIDFVLRPKWRSTVERILEM